MPVWHGIILFQAYLRINCYKVKKAYWLAKSVCEKSWSTSSHFLRIITMPTNRVAKVMFSATFVCHCLSTSVQGSSPASPTYRGPWPHPRTRPKLFNLAFTVHGPSPAPQTVGIRLKCLLVKSKIRHLIIVGRYIPVISCKSCEGAFLQNRKSVQQRISERKPLRFMEIQVLKEQLQPKAPTSHNYNSPGMHCFISCAVDRGILSQKNKPDIGLQS